MPVRYIGRKAEYKGKFLFNILCNLKNFGVGRMVVRRSYLERYAEPSYYIIKEPQPDMTDPALKRGFIKATQVFRGKQSTEELPIRSAYKPDWWLVPKEEEVKYLTNTAIYETRETPASVPLPPLLAQMYTSKLHKEGRQVTKDDLRLKLVIRQGQYNRARPSERISPSESGSD